MEKFFNLSFLKYPISLIINMILVGFYLYIFPAKATTKVRENEFAAINLDIPSADKKIEEKNAFNQENNGENGDFSAAEIAQNERIDLDNSRSDFIVRTSKKSSLSDLPNTHYHRPEINRKSYYPPKSRDDSPYNQIREKAEFNDNSFKNKSPYQEAHGKTIEKLEERIKELEERKKLNANKISSENTANLAVNLAKKDDGFSFKDQDLVPKNGDLNLAQNPLIDSELSTNRFYSNDKKRQNIQTVQLPKAKQNTPDLLKGRLLESKTVRNNTTVKIILTERKVIGNVVYESGDVIGAKTGIQGDRLMLTVEGYIKNDVYVPLSAQVMDLDGLLGLKVSIDADNEMQKQAWGQNAGSTLGSVNPLLVYNPQGNLGQTVGNQVVGSLVNQSLNGANQYVNAKIRDVKVSIKTGQQLYLLIKN
jgi:Conjugative transposon, TraM